MTDKPTFQPMPQPEACFCMGPQNGEPFCRCEMRRRGIREVDGRWVEPQHDHGPAKSRIDKEFAALLAALGDDT